MIRTLPFGANSKRHISFASVGITLIIEDSTDIGRDEKDLRINTYHTSGAGGHHANKTESAAHLMHYLDRCLSALNATGLTDKDFTYVSTKR